MRLLPCGIPRRLLAIALLGGPALAGCGGPTGPITVGWRLAGGRTCADSGVTQVGLGGVASCPCGDGGAGCDGSCRFPCAAGWGGGEGHRVDVTLTGSGTLTGFGFTPIGTSLYRGDVHVESLAPVDLELYFTGGP